MPKTSFTDKKMSKSPMNKLKSLSTSPMDKLKSLSPMDKLKSLSPMNTSVNLDSSNIALFIINLISIIIVIILHYSIYTWTAELEKTGCKCSDIWHRDIIHWLALILLIMLFITTLLRMTIDYNNLLITPAFAGFVFIVVIFSIFYVAMVYDYIRKLKELQCECSESWKREYGYIASIVYLVFYSILIIPLLLGLILSGIMYMFK